MPFKISKSDAPISSSAAAGSATTTLTATGGVKTVTLSSSAMTSTSVIVKPTTAPVAHNTTTPCDTKTVVTIHSAYTNCTTLSTVPAVVPTSNKAVPTASGVTPPPAQVTSAAGRLGAGIFAAMVIAAFAL